jgi:uncharacterized protein (DUF2141 family)
MRVMKKVMISSAAAAMLALAASANAGSVISNDMSKCGAGQGPAIQVNVRGIKGLSGKIRVQNYPATSSAWLAKGRWLHRMEARASASALNFCVPIAASGKYAIAVRHDKNANGKTDISSDGGGFSNNPSINILNLGKPSVSKVAFSAGPGVTTITVNLQYM